MAHAAQLQSRVDQASALKSQRFEDETERLHKELQFLFPLSSDIQELRLKMDRSGESEVDLSHLENQLIVAEEIYHQYKEALQGHSETETDGLISSDDMSKVDDVALRKCYEKLEELKRNNTRSIDKKTAEFQLFMQLYVVVLEIIRRMQSELNDQMKAPVRHMAQGS